MAIGPCTEGHRSACDGDSDWLSTVPLSAAGLQLDYASASVLLVRPAQSFGGFL